MSTDVLVLLIVFLIVSGFGFLGVLGTLLLMSRDTTRIPELISRVTNIEQLTQRLSSDVSAEVGMNTGPMREIWRSADGRYVGDSFEDLISKMATDPDGPLSQDEIDAIKSIFEKIMGERDDDEDGSEPWKKK